jgi:chromosome segregation ATPase
MKISSVILATVFLGLATHMGPRCLESIQNRCDRAGRVTIRYGRDRIHTVTDRRTDIPSPELKALRARQSEIGTRIREVESALRKIKSSEGTLTRRLEELERRGRQVKGLRAGEEVIAAVHASKTALMDHIDLLIQERGAFEGFLEQLKNEQASLKVKIELYEVSQERARTERFLTGNGRGPLDDLNLEARRQRNASQDGHGGIVY